ncbi:MAG: hypothetical protein BWK79_10530 [Beggiatoa sp. IS2]|nr:MAG: hypothetical protein BWK79_10530 [Beggiatoa sp. IS2]
MVYFRYLLILLVFSCLPLGSVHAVTYYVSTQGDDNNDGLTPQNPWASLEKVNNFLFQPGDTILFKRGDEWRGHIEIKYTGAEGTPITYAAYGDDPTPKPIINGTELITNWSPCTPETCGDLPHVANIYVATVNLPQVLYKSHSQDPGKYYDQGISQLFIDDQAHLVARHPNTGYLYIEKRVNDSTLQIKSEDWDKLPTHELVNGQAYTKSARWILATELITAVNPSQRTLTFGSSKSHSFVTGWGYFLNNRLAFLDTEGEWFFDETTKKIYVWPRAGIDPNKMRVEGSTYLLNVSESDGTLVDLLIDGIIIAADKPNYSVKYITIRDLHIRYHSGSGILAKNSYMTLENNVIEYPDANGIEIMLWGDTGKADNFVKINNNVIDSPNSRGINLILSNSEVTGNIVTNVARFERLGRLGMAGVTPKNRDYVGSATEDGIGIRVLGNDNVISHNYLDYIGHNGIFFTGKNLLIENNVINHSCYTKADCGGIYCFYGREYTEESSNLNVTLRKNIVMNSIGDTQGAKRYDPNAKDINYEVPFGMGIYIDGFARGITLEKNTAFNNSAQGFNIHDSSDITLVGNVSYNNQVQLYLPIQLASHTENITLKENVLYSLDKGQSTLSLPRMKNLPKENSINLLKESDHNYFFNPYTRNAPSDYRDPYQYLIERHEVINKYSLPEWQAEMKFDKHSTTNWFELKPYEIVSAGENMIQNGQFDTDTTNWIGRPKFTWSADKIEGGGLEINRNGGSWGTLAQYSPEFSVEMGKFYQIRFSAVADKQTASISTTFQKVGTDDDAGLQAREWFMLSPEVKTFAEIFTPKETTAVNFQFGTSKTAMDLYWLDNVDFREVAIRSLPITVSNTVDEMGYDANFKSALFPLKAILFYNKTAIDKVINLEGVTYRTLNNLKFGEDPAFANLYNAGNLQLPAFTSVVLLVDTVAAMTPFSIVVNDSASDGQIVGTTFYTLTQDGNVHYYADGNWQTISLNDLGFGLPQGGFKSEIKGLLYLRQGNGTLPAGSLFVTDNTGKLYQSLPPHKEWTVTDLAVDALFSILTATGETVAYLEGTEAIIADTGARFSLSSIGFPSTEPVIAVSRDDGGTFYYLVTASKKIYIYNALTSEWLQQQ